VSPTDNPPVCKIADYGKYQYRQSKIERKQRQKQKVNELKGIRLSIGIGDHDFQVKVSQASKFLKARHSVKVALILKGREISYANLAIDKLNEFAKALAGEAQLDIAPKKQGYNVFMVMTPL
jgi:translation initiation factor IF-3